MYSPFGGFIYYQHKDQLPIGLLAQLVEQCTSIARSWVQIPYGPEFFQAIFSLPVK